MTREQLEDLLRSQPDALEGEYRSRPLPMTIDAAHRVVSEPSAKPLQMVAAGVAGALVALALIVAGSAAGLFTPDLNAEDSAGVGSDVRRSCGSADFDLRTEEWPDAPMSGGVLVILEARQAADCEIDTGLYATVDDADGAGSVAAVVGLREAVNVEPGAAFQLGVYWSTYCGDAGGTVAAPDRPERPLTLSVGLMVSGGEDDGVPVSVPDTLIPVETSSEIAPEPCTQEYAGSPFWLGLDGLEPYSTSSSAAQRLTDEAEAAMEAAVKAAEAARDAAVKAAEAALRAAELFEQTDTCSTSLAGLDVVVEFPAAWSTNRDAADDGVPCLWYGPAPFEVVAGAQGRPAGAAITLGAVGGPPGEPSRTADVVTHAIMVAGRPALSMEEHEAGGGRGERRLTYWVPLSEGGPTLVATTSSADAESYELTAAVLGEMMRRLEIRDPSAP